MANQENFYNDLNMDQRGNNLMDANSFQNMNVGQPQTIPYQQANVYSNSASAMQGQGNNIYMFA